MSSKPDTAKTGKSPTIRSSLKEFRLARGLSQLELASKIGLSRQSLCALEGGHVVPGTDVALRLALVLGCRIESLFCLNLPPTSLQATIAAAPSALESSGPRVSLAEIDGRWVAHPIDPRRSESLFRAADGLVVPWPRPRGSARTVCIEPLGDIETVRRRLVVMGCAPALGMLAARLGQEPAGIHISWVQGSSMAALDALARGEVHIAGLHLCDEATHEFNVPFVRRALPGRAMLFVNFASWEQGIVVRAGNPLGVRGAEDLVNPRIRLVQREPGAGAHKLLEQALRAKRVPLGTVRGRGGVALGHMEVAQAIAMGAADAGIAIRGAAAAFGLGFVPLAVERFDLVIPRVLATDPRVERLVDALGSTTFRRELDTVGGYITHESGQQVGETRAR
ncbi:MAG: substrate-binding domain-containing protein [Polyangia bacterium]|jgi:molybdate-binding protein/DNA-binding XRE family transcriptional regulator